MLTETNSNSTKKDALIGWSLQEDAAEKFQQVVGYLSCDHSLFPNLLRLSYQQCHFWATAHELSGYNSFTSVWLRARKRIEIVPGSQVTQTKRDTQFFVGKGKKPFSFKSDQICPHFRLFLNTQKDFRVIQFKFSFDVVFFINTVLGIFSASQDVML